MMHGTDAVSLNEADPSAWMRGCVSVNVCVGARVSVSVCVSGCRRMVALGRVSW